MTEIERLLSDPKSRRLYEIERLTVAVTEDILRLMVEKGVSRAVLARRLGVSRPLVTQMLNGNRNMTLRTLAKIAHALGCQTTIAFREVG